MKNSKEHGEGVLNAPGSHREPGTQKGSPSAPPGDRSERAERRRAQVLEAATQCFREHGFHGTSIARISQAAGMSVGHIYHYFENKEAIISAIVEQDLQQVRRIDERIREAGGEGDLIEATLNDLPQCVQEMIDDPNAPLMLEIVAEAARNPAVASVVRDADDTALSYFEQLSREMLARRGMAASKAARIDLTGPNLVLSALFEGLLIRTIRNPQLDRQKMLPVLARVTRYLLEMPLAPDYPPGVEDGADHAG